MNKNIDEYKNLVALLEQALLFYGNEKNYVKGQKLDNKSISMVNIDNGSQARFALNKITGINEKFDVGMFKDIENMIDNDNPEHILNMIEEYKKIVNN